ncbi:MAG: SDR family oxidoreductase [Elusimicrobia bacterium]|nr:SDR family oxidoreductase [Elusimicrobiota bacterium]
MTEALRENLLHGQVAVVTGGGTGIGKIIARDLASHGARVVIASRNLERLEATAAELRALGGSVKAAACDISDPAQVKTLANAVLAEHGRADILVNNAAANFIWPSEKMTPVRWRKVIDIVLNGTFYCSLEFGSGMLAQSSGSIVNIVAAYAWTGAPGLAPSASAKAGVMALTRTLGAEWAGRGVRVNAIAPGPIDVPQTRERLWPTEEMRRKVLAGTPLGRFGSEEDVSALVLFLSSELGRNITGEVITTDGGQSLGRGALDMLGEIQKLRRKPAPASA